ncbi:MAG: glycosyltransferase family 4 protein [Bacteroidaceae bacterium]|nr:glycosyltransferase family 4 protein [Bacteroidaceae bacterium]
MKITHIIDTFGGGGKERRCLQLIQGLNKAGYKDIQVIIVNNDIAYKELYECECQVIVIDRKNRGLSFSATKKEVKRHISAFSPDIVQAWGMMSALFTMVAFPFMKFKFICSYIGSIISPKFPSELWFINNFCKIRSKVIIANTKAGIKAFGIPEQKAKVVYNGFNEDRFLNIVNINEKRKELGIDTKYVVAMVATFSNNKDYPCYINAAKYIISKRDDITFLAVGSGALWEEINNMLNENDRKRIKLLGRRKDVDEIYQICTMTVLCSNTITKEGLSNSIMESMAFGTPVLATDGGGTPEIIKDGSNGFIIKEQTPEKVAEQILGIIDDEKSLGETSVKSKETVKSDFLLSRMTTDYIKLYNSLK